MPQLVCLRQLLIDGELTPGQLAKEIYLSQATVTGIIDRLEFKGLIKRQRNKMDRRKILVRLSDRGTQTANDIPWPLQEDFSKKLNILEESEKAQIDTTLKRLVEMMEMPSIPTFVIDANDTKKQDITNISQLNLASVL